MKATNKGGDFTPYPLPPEDRYAGRCYMVVDFGTIPQEFQGQTKKQRRAWIAFEIPYRIKDIDEGSVKKVAYEFNEEKGPQPYSVGVEMTLSTSDRAKLPDFIEAWRGRPLSAEEKEEFPVEQMLGKPAMVMISHKRKKDYAGKKLDNVNSEHAYIKLETIKPCPKLAVKLPSINDQVLFDWDDPKFQADSFDLEYFKEKFDQVPGFLQKKIVTSDEYMAIQDLLVDNGGYQESDEAPWAEDGGEEPAEEGTW